MITAINDIGSVDFYNSITPAYNYHIDVQGNVLMNVECNNINEFNNLISSRIIQHDVMNLTASITRKKLKLLNPSIEQPQLKISFMTDSISNF